MTIDELALQVVEAMKASGYAVYTAWSEYRDAFMPIIRFHEQHGKSELDFELLSEYTREIEERIDRREISVGHYGRLKRGAKRLAEFYNTRKLQWSCPCKVSRFKLNEYYENLLIKFLACEEWHRNTHGDVTWVTKKYFSWLIQEEFSTLDNVGAPEIQKFMYYCYQHMRGSRVHNVKLYMKKLYRYLSENGYSAEDYKELLSFPVSRESRMLPAVSSEEISSVLDVIDRHVPKGKRDYAIILLGVVTGLRAGDIARLKLSDIDWKNGEIKIVQTKTGVSLALPLTQDVGEAIQDYILQGRQQSESDAVFLRHHVPFQAFADGVAIGDMYDDYRKRAGLPREAFDGKGFHSLRRAAGKNMVTSGVPVTTVAQVLGHGNIDSTKKYISLDSHHLKECALDFTGIEQEVAQ